MIDARDGEHDLLESIGQALYGERWQTGMSRDLEISDRQMRRWVAGAKIPPGVFVDLMRIMQERAAILDDLAIVAKRYGGGV